MNYFDSFGILCNCYVCDWIRLLSNQKCGCKRSAGSAAGRANFGRDRNQTGNCSGPEWVSASWILLDWSRVLNEVIFLLSGSHSQPRVKLHLRDHSSATFAEKFCLENKTFENTFKVMRSMNATFVENFSN